MSSFAANLDKGLIGEGRIAKWLRSRGWNVLPAYQVEIDSGKGPRLYTANTGELVTPDMLAFKNGKIVWFEAKTKNAFTWYRIGHCWQDGIDLRHWHDYCKVADVSGWEVWLLFLHDSKGVAKDTPEGMTPPVGLFGQSICRLKNCIDHESDKHANGMVYWNLQSLLPIKGIIT